MDHRCARRSERPRTSPHCRSARKIQPGSSSAAASMDVRLPPTHALPKVRRRYPGIFVGCGQPALQRSRGSAYGPWVEHGWAEVGLPCLPPRRWRRAVIPWHFGNVARSVAVRFVCGTDGPCTPQSRQRVYACAGRCLRGGRRSGTAGTTRPRRRCGTRPCRATSSKARFSPPSLPY